MSSIDERVVKMEFDNAKFESGVKESLNTIENLTVSLNNLDKTKVSFDQIQRAAAGINIDSIADNVDKISDRFDSLGIVGGTVIAKLTNSVIDFATRGLNSLTSSVRQAWDSINTGGMQRAKNIENAKFQIEGLGRTWEEVSDSIDEAVNETAYGLDEAALAASQFLATGIQTGDEMTTALRSISGVAAMTNSGYSEIARIMTTIAGNGRVMTMQLNQLGMKGINAAATLRDYFNSSSENLEKFTKLYNETKNKNDESLAPGVAATEQNIRDMVSKGAIDFNTFAEAMDQAYGDHAKDAQRTFEGASSNVQAALKRLGAEFKSVTISSEDYDKTLDSNKKTDFTKTTFNQINVLNELRNVIKGLQSDMKAAGFVELFSDIYHAISRGTSFFLNSLYVTDNAGTHLIPQLSESLNNLKASFENVAGFVVGIASAFSSAWKVVFPQSLPDTILNITSRIKDFTDRLPRVNDIFGSISDIFGLSGDVANETSDSLENLEKVYTGSFEGLKGILMGLFAILNMIKTVAANLVTIIGKFVAPVVLRVVEVLIEILGTIGSFIEALSNVITKSRQTGEALKFVSDILRPLWNLFHWVTQGIIDFMRAIRPDNDPLRHLKEYLSGFLAFARNLGGDMGSVLDTIKGFIVGLIDRIGGIELPNGKRISESLSVIFDPVINVVKNVASRIENIKFPDGSTLYSKLKASFGGIPEYLKRLSSQIQNRASGIFSFFSTMKERIADSIQDDSTSIPSRIEYVFEPILYTLRRIQDKLANVFAPLLEFLSPITSAIGNLIGKIVDGFKNLIDSIAVKLSSIPDMTKDLKRRFDPIIEYLRPLANNIKYVLGVIVEHVGSFINNVANSIDFSKNPFENIIEVIKNFGTNVSETFQNLANSKIVSSIKTFATTVLTSLSSGVQTLLSGIKRVFSPIFEALSSVFGMFNAKAYGDTLDNNMEELGDNLDQANAAIENPGNSLLNTLESFATKLIKIVPLFATSLLAFLTVYNYGVRLPKDISKLLRSLTGGVDSFTSFFAQLTKSLQKITKAIEFSILAEGFKSLAISLAVLAGVVIIFGNIDWSVIQQGLIGITLLGTMLIGFTALLGLIAKAANLNEFGTGVLKIAAACLIFIVSLGALMKMLGAKTEIVNGQTVTVYKNLQNILVAAGTLALIITAILVPITAAVAIAGKLGGKFGDLGKAFAGIGLGLIALVIAINLMQRKLQEVATEGTWATFLGGIVLLIAIAGVMMLLQSKLSTLDQSAEKTGLGFALMSAGLLAIAYAIQMISGIDIAQIAASTLALAVILGLLIGMLHIISSGDIDMKTVGEGILKMAVAIAVLAVSLMLISTLGDNLNTSVISLAFLMVMLMALAEVCANAQSSLVSGGVGMLMMAAAIAVLAAALFFLQDVAKSDNLSTMMIMLAAVTAALIALGLVCSKAEKNMLPGAAAILVIAVALGILVAALSYLIANADVGTLMGVVLAIVVLVAVIGILAYVAEELSVGFVLVAAVFLALTAVVLSLAVALYAGGLAFTMIAEAILAFSEANVDIAGIAGGLVVLGISLVVLAAGSAVLGAAMIVLGAGALIGAVGIGALAVAMLSVIAVIYIAVMLFQQAGQAIMEGLLGGILSGIGGVVSAIAGVASSLIGGFCSILGIHSPSWKFMEYGKHILEGLKIGMSGGADLGQNFGSLVGDGAMEGLSESFGNFDLSSMVGDSFDVSKLGDVLGDSGTNWMNSLGVGMSKSDEPVEVSEEKVRESAEAADAQTEIFKDVGAHAIQWFATGMREFDASSFYNSFTGENGLAAQMEQAIAEIQFDSSGFYNAGVTCMGAFLEGVDSTIENIKTRISTIIQGAAANVSVPDLTGPGSQMAVSFISGLNSHIEESRDAGYNLAQAAHDGGSGVDMWWTGHWMGVGFVNGIRSQIDSASTAGTALGMAAANAARAAGKVSSPSKVMMAVGGYYGKGFAIGISSQMSNVRRASTKMSEVLIDTMSMLPEFFDVDPDLEPTITPVMDMSNVEASMRSINSNPVLRTDQIGHYFAIADYANNAASAIAGGNKTYNINLSLLWEAGDDANAVLEELAEGIDAKLRMEG